MDCKLSSQSSGISLADLSVNGISDSELDNEDTILVSTKSSCATKSSHSLKNHVGESSGGLGGLSSQNQLQCIESLIPRDTRLLNREAAMETPMMMPLGDVRFALQENQQLLNDHTLLKDLLQSIDIKLASSDVVEGSYSSSNPKNLDNNLSSFSLPNRDPGPCARRSTSDQNDPFHTNQIKTIYNHENGLWKDKRLESASYLKDINGKHVTFDQDPSNDIANVGNLAGNMLAINRPDHLLEQMSRIRWKLNGWEDEGLQPPADRETALMFCQKLLQALQVNQEQKKHLEGCLATSEGKLKKSEEETEVLRRLNQKRESRLREVDAQIGIVQHQWIEAHTATCSETLKLKREMDAAKREKESLKEDLSALENELRRLEEVNHNYHAVKTTLEEIQGQFAASRKQTAEIAEENARLNQKLEDRQKRLQELEEEELPKLKVDLEEASVRYTNFEKSYQKLVRTNAHLTDDMRMLHDQHKTLLQKVILEEEQKENALKEKEALESKVKSLTSEMSMTKSELHDHYQSQVKELVNQRTEKLQEQLSSLESTLKNNLAQQLDAQRETHRHALNKIQEGHSKEVEDLCNAHSSRVTQLQNQMRQLQEENHALRTQHQGIVTAVSSILNPELQSKNTRALLEFPIMASTSTPINTRPVSPQADRFTMGKGTSGNGSRPASGKSGQSNGRVPRLGRICTSSSDSDASVFQDGIQTVRHFAGSSQSNLKTGGANNARQIASNPVKFDYGDYEYRSLPDLQNQIDKSVSPRKTTSRGNKVTGARKSGSFSGVELSRPNLRKIYRASEILKNDDEAIGDFPSLSPANFEMGRLIEELKSIKSSTKTSDSEVPTHDTSFDQDPANITLRKLSQVSTLLSHYVNNAPTSS